MSHTCQLVARKGADILENKIGCFEDESLDFARLFDPQISVTHCAHIVELKVKKKT